MYHRKFTLFILFFIHIFLLRSQDITIHFAGDFMVGSWGISVIRENGYDFPVEKLKPLFEKGDLNFCNLEVPLTTTQDTFPNKTFHFKIPPDFVEILTRVPVHYVTLANNHILDYNPAGLFQTIQILKKNHIAYSGAGENLSMASKPAILHIKDITIGIVAAAAIFPKGFWATDSTPGIFFPWRERLIEIVDSTRKVVDLLFVTFHWGAEKRNTPKKYQIGLAHLVINHGADLVWGHHPHVIQGIEFYKGKPIFYSLGNFIFASYSRTQTGMIVQVTYNHKKLSRIKLYPLKLDQNPPLQPTILESSAAKKFFEQVIQLSDSLNKKPLKTSLDSLTIIPRY
jgi:poly-gamma-glutamate synthesis protein (capsule biosynthesis protein)